MKYLLLEAAGWIGLAAGALLFAGWITGNLYGWGI